MIAAYGRIVVQLDAPLVSIIVNVQKYACQTPGYGTGQADRMAFKDRLLGAIGGVRGIVREGMTASGFVGVFSGKGTMDDIAKCLRLAARHRIFHHARPYLRRMRPGVSAIAARSGRCLHRHGLQWFRWQLGHLQRRIFCVCEPFAARLARWAYAAHIIGGYPAIRYRRVGYWCTHRNG